MFSSKPEGERILSLQSSHAAPPGAGQMGENAQPRIAPWGTTGRGADSPVRLQGDWDHPYKTGRNRRAESWDGRTLVTAKRLRLMNCSRDYCCTIVNAQGIGVAERVRSVPPTYATVLGWPGVRLPRSR